VEKIGVAVIGGGAVGCAVAYELAKAGTSDLFVFEKLPYVGEGQSGRNSGVIHAGIYYTTGSQKALLCVEANTLMYQFCREHDVTARNVGKLVVASSQDEIELLENLHTQALENGVPGVRMLTHEQVQKIESNVSVPAAMLCPTTGIVDAAGYTRTLAKLAQIEGAQVMTNFEITRIESTGDGFEIAGRSGESEEVFKSEVLINSAGLYSDVIARMVNPQVEWEISPLRGEYYKFSRKKRDELWLNGLNIYPVPEKVDIGGREVGVVGVHLTPTFEMVRDGETRVGDTVTVGPEFVAVSDREDYESNRKPAEFFLQRAERFFPGLKLDDLQVDFTGIMANLHEGSDFIIKRDDTHDNAIQLVGIDSPGLTCSLSIAKRVWKLLNK
jgi:glycerol-3-phosphate dehydrogenase